MPKTTERLTKKRVSEELDGIRKRTAEVCGMNEKQLLNEYERCFPAGCRNPLATLGEMRYTLIASAVYRAADYLNVKL